MWSEEDNEDDNDNTSLDLHLSSSDNDDDDLDSEKEIDNILTTLTKRPEPGTDDGDDMGLPPRFEIRRIARPRWTSD